MIKMVRLALFALFIAVAGLATSGSAHAYSNSRLMDDQIFDNSGSMSESQIQSFLASKGPCLANYSDVDPSWNGSTWSYTGSVSAAHIIYKVSQQWGLNPQVIIATLQKEESLITGTSCDGWRYNSAMGYGCPDSGGCNAKYAGFTRQVLWGSWQLKFNKERSYGNLAWDGDGDITYVGYMTAGVRKRCNACSNFSYDGNVSIDGQVIHLDNGTTASLYTYTPHLGQSFPGIFESWFGTVLSDQYRWQMESITYSRGNDQIPSTEKEVITLRARNTGYATWSNSGGTVIKLGTWNPGRTSSFYDPSWADPIRPAILQESSVAPNEVGTFQFVIQAPSAGVYNEAFNLVAEGQAWFNNAGFNPSFQVSPYSYNAQFVSDNIPTTMASGTTTSAMVTMKNTGSNYWYKTGSAPAKLGTYNPAGHDSPFAHSSWANASRAATMTESVVAPGANATFAFTLKSPDAVGSISDTFAVVAEGWSWMPSSAFTKTIAVTGTYSATPTTQQSNIIQMVAGETKTQTLSYTNTGTATWSKTNFPQLKLGAANPYGRSSVFADSTWLDNTRPSSMNEASVATGATATFGLSLKAPIQPGTYTETFAPVAEGISWVNAPVTFTIVVAPPDYSWQIISQTTNPAIDPGDDSNITLVAKNTGNTTWYKSSGFPVKLGTWLPERLSKIASDTWPSPTRPAVMTENSVPPGSNGTFTFIAHAPYPGLFNERFNLVSEGSNWLNDIGYNLAVTVRGNYPWNYVWHPVSVTSSTGSFNLAAGQSATITLTARNDGDTYWHGHNDFPVKLGTNEPQYRTSAFQDSSWPSSSRAAVLNETTVPPNANGTFSFVVHAPSTPGIYHESFNMVVEGIRWFNDPGFNFDLTVH
jgi:hypothetical protein